MSVRLDPLLSTLLEMAVKMLEQLGNQSEDVMAVTERAKRYILDEDELCDELRSLKQILFPEVDDKASKCGETS